MQLLILLSFVCALGLQVTSKSDTNWDFDVSSKEEAQRYWQKFKSTYNKSYGSETEEYFRKHIFLDSVLEMQEHNEKHSKHLVSFEKGINQFSDMPYSEFKDKLLGCSLETNVTDDDEGYTFIPLANVELPDEVDWRKDGAVTAVKNQLWCGSCYSFAATGSLEGQHFRKNDKLVSLSEQQLVDCSHNSGNDGCNGGLAQWAFSYIKKNKGIDTEESYPYEAFVNRCRYNPENKGATDRGYYTVKKQEKDLQNAVATIGPIAISMWVKEDFKTYRRGVYYDETCNQSNAAGGHAVLVVGYGKDPDDPNPEYWLVKNSWGEEWGETGYFRIARNKNACEITRRSVYPVV